MVSATANLLQMKDQPFQIYTMISTKYNDYPQEQIDAKLKQVEEFEAKYGESTRTIAWKKWCTDHAYRQREWQFRQATAANIKPNVDYR